MSTHRLALLAALALAVPLVPRPAAAQPVQPWDREAGWRLVFGGDVNLGTNLERGGVPPDGGRTILAPIRAALQADATVINLEGPFGEGRVSTKCGPRPSGRCFAFQTPTPIAARLVDAGITHAQVANNHAFDMGAEGLAHTVRTLEGLGIRAYGHRHGFRVDTLRAIAGRPLRVAFVAAATSPGLPSVLDPDSLASVVRAARAVSDLVVVTLHAGGEGRRALRLAPGPERFAGEERGDPRRLSRTLHDAGARIVVFHGPHVLRAIERVGDGLTAYSLGNLAAWHGFSSKPPIDESMLLDVRVAPDGTLDASVIPLRQRTHVGPRADRAARSWTRLCALARLDLPATGLCPSAPHGRLVPLPAPSHGARPR